MVANHVIEIYTLLFGWAMYESIWDILIGTGLAYIPFFAVLLQCFINSRNPLQSIKGAQAELEFRLIGIFAVLIILVIPWSGGGGTTIADFRYEIATPFCAGTEQLGHSASGDADNTGTSNDAALGSALGGYAVHPPLGWSVVMIASTAITNAAISSISCVNNYNFLMSRISQIKIEDGAVNQRIEEFTQVCYTPALAELNANSTNAGMTFGSSVLDQPDWLGNSLFLTTTGQYYQQESAYLDLPNGQYNFTNNPTLRPLDATSASMVKPSCKQVWEGDGTLPITTDPEVTINQSLRDTIYYAIPEDDIGNIRDEWETWGSGLFGTLTPSQERDLLVKLIIAAQSIDSPSASFEYSADGFSQNGSFTNIADIASVISQIPDRIGKAVEYKIVTVIAPFIAMFIQMMIVIGAPFVMAANSYKFETFLSLAVAWFGIEFMNFIWAAISWFDTHLYDMFADVNNPSSFWEVVGKFFTTSPTALVSSNMIEGYLLNQLAMYLSFILPGVWLILVGAMGSKMVSRVGDAIGGGAAMGKGAGNAASQATTSTMKSVGTGGKSLNAGFVKGMK